MRGEIILHVLKPGVYTTFQDMGRIGYQRYGVPVSGAMDPFALQVANILVGNKRNTACLEVTLVGPKLEVRSPITVAITGADLEPKVNGQNKEMWTSFHLKKGDILTFDSHKSGVRAYIAVAGGFEAPAFFGSKSTDMKSGFGTALTKNDTLKGFPQKVKSSVGVKKDFIPVYKKSIDVAVVKGPHTDAFTKKGIENFFHTKHIVEANSNRMGYRLKSEKIGLKKDIDIWSDAVPPGGIQVPPNGQPIILMAERQTTGGYPRIGTVVSTDLEKLAQLIPQGEITFHSVSVDEAQKRAVKRERFLYELAMFYSYI
ncbi:5-oxoprolinase subunit C family protein [Virgibacillus alimentarius]|uniref:5-oxoprolinase subunit C family protein n=1 Tax=Virgibacillus alimentarius TaxID=698769 RepID=UPI0004931239|nr:biotin-dependent carboxyltransferase family protein [Virgibacillus alimentarius]